MGFSPVGNASTWDPDEQAMPEAGSLAHINDFR